MKSKPIQSSVLVSACLMGRRVRYDGGHSASAADVLARWRQEGRIVAFCPEVAGGLATPRAPAEIVGGGAEAVLDGHARVQTDGGEDVTEAFLAGARGALEAAKKAGARAAVLKSKSPSCGSQKIYDGSFDGVLVDGVGVTTAFLRRHGIEVFNEHQLDSADAWLRRCDEHQIEQNGT